MSSIDSSSDIESDNAEMIDNEVFINFKTITTNFIAELLSTINSDISKSDALLKSDDLYENYEKLLTSYNVDIEQLCSNSSNIEEIENIFKTGKKPSVTREKKPPTQKQLDARKKKQEIANKWKKLTTASKDIWEKRSFDLYMDKIKEVGPKDAYKVKSSSGFLLYSKYDGIGNKWTD
jgi:hypothetical protein